MKLRKLRKLNNGCYSLYDSDGDIVASNNPDTPCSKKLSKQNCDEIFGVVDVEKLAYKTYGPETFVNHSDMYKYLCIKFFKEGFNKSMELNKDKLFTVDDLYRAFLINSAGNNTTLRNFFEQTVLPMFEQPTEIEVRIAMGCSLTNGCTEPEVECTCEPTYNLDENGCLTLWVLNI